MAVYDNPIDQGGRKLADGTVGLPRPDVAMALGNPSWRNSGFAAVVTADTLSNVSAGPLTVYTYLHAPNKGWWFHTGTVGLDPPPAPLTYTEDPLINIAQPQNGQDVSQSQRFAPWVTFFNSNRFPIAGFALDRNAVAAGNVGPFRSGVCRIQIYIDGPRGVGSVVGGNPNASGNVEIGIGGSGFGALSGGAPTKGGTPWVLGHPVDQFSHMTDQYGPQYTTAGWAVLFNPSSLSLGTHKVYAYALSCGTGTQTGVTIQGLQLFINPTVKENVATVSFNIIDVGPRHV
jgi:hypothetical protein